MSGSTPTPGLYPALLAAMREFGPVLKNATNPAFRTKYADLGAVLDSVTDPLLNHGILLLQRFTHDQGGAILITELVHAESGQSISSEVPVVSKDPTDPQKMGGAITYYRRYSILALLGLAPEDDDGNSASTPAPRKQPEPKRTPDATPAEGMRLYPGNGAARTSAPAAPSAPAAATPLTAKEYDALIERAWTALENGATLDSIKAGLNAERKRMSEAQRIVTIQQLGAIETAIAERAAPSISG